MHRGWTKRWRKRWDSGYHHDPLMWVIMDYFIDFAAYKDKSIYKKGFGIIKLKRGEWAFTTRDLAQYLRVSRQKIRTSLKMLQNIEFLTLRATLKYTIASVINYDIYQPTEEEANPVNNPNLTHTQPTPNPVYIYTKKDKNYNNIKTSPADADILDKINKLADWLYESKRFPKVHPFKNKMLKTNKNKSAILHTLEQLKKSGLSGNSNCWAYCAKIMGVENGNFNEAEYRDNIERQKRELKKWQKAEKTLK